DATIENSRRMRAIAKEYGSFAAWLAEQHPRKKDEWVKLFRDTFLFMGGEVVGEFLMSTGYLPGAHAPTCPVYKRILKLDPAWRRAQSQVVSAASAARAVSYYSDAYPALAKKLRQSCGVKAARSSPI